MASTLFGKKQRTKLGYTPEEVEFHLERLRQQAMFTRGYSPLLTAILETLIGWLAEPLVQGEKLGEPDALAALCHRLFDYLEDTRHLSDVEASLRVGSTLHWYVLQGDERVKALRPYYRSVGGSADPTDAGLATALFECLDGLGELLFEHARDWSYQSNETSRGLAWLLPTALLGVESIHLVELGACAGLNLYGEQRGFDLRWSDGRVLRVGRAAQSQFVVDVRGSDFANLDARAARGPDVLSRMGGDLHPLDLRVPANETRLAACVWGDQPHRMERLRDGLAIHESALAGELEPVAEVQSLELPDGLEQFLAEAIPRHPEAPVVAFNTYVTAYLNDVGQRSVARTMAAFAHRWSVQHGLPWMWVRFEPARTGEASEPHPGWCRWLVEVWEGSRHRRFDLGWAHPHMHALELGPDVDALREIAG